jgi:hypothetical protein
VRVLQTHLVAKDTHIKHPTMRTIQMRRQSVEVAVPTGIALDSASFPFKNEAHFDWLAQYLTRSWSSVSRGLR